MGKRCDCGFVMAMFEGDPRLACLPLAVRALWLVLVRKMQQLGQSALVLGSEIPKPSEVAMMVAVSETELETYLEPLMARGLLVRRADGALECPLLVARQSRSETARINGLKGGRPRKDGSPARQREILLPVAGGLAAETQKPSAGGLGSAAKLSSLPEEKAPEAKPCAVTPERVQAVGRAAAEAAGLDPVRGAWTFGPVRQWLEAGADETLILRVVLAVMARPNRPYPKGLGYFSQAVMAELAVAPVAEALPAEAWSESAADYNARCDAWEARGRVGSPPVRQRAAA
jgi:hypothetical protein